MRDRLARGNHVLSVPLATVRPPVGRLLPNEFVAAAPPFIESTGKETTDQVKTTDSLFPCLWRGPAKT